MVFFSHGFAKKNYIFLLALTVRYEWAIFGNCPTQYLIRWKSVDIINQQTNMYLFFFCLFFSSFGSGLPTLYKAVRRIFSLQWNPMLAINTNLFAFEVFIEFRWILNKQPEWTSPFVPSYDEAHFKKRQTTFTFSMCIFPLDSPSVFFALPLSTDKLRLPFRFVGFAYLLPLIFTAFETLSAYRFMKHTVVVGSQLVITAQHLHTVLISSLLVSASLRLVCLFEIFLSFDLSSHSIISTDPLNFTFQKKKNNWILNNWNCEFTSLECFRPLQLAFVALNFA